MFFGVLCVVRCALCVVRVSVSVSVCVCMCLCVSVCLCVCRVLKKRTKYAVYIYETSRWRGWILLRAPCLSFPAHSVETHITSRADHDLRTKPNKTSKARDHDPKTNQNCGRNRKTHRLWDFLQGLVHRSMNVFIDFWVINLWLRQYILKPWRGSLARLHKHNKRKHSTQRMCNLVYFWAMHSVPPK